MTVYFDHSNCTMLHLILKFYWSIIKRQRISTTQGCDAYLTPYNFANSGRHYGNSGQNYSGQILHLLIKIVNFKPL